MSEEKSLEIFKPLKSYFAILCQQKCYNYSESKCGELIDILSRKNCDKSENLSDNFINALSWFATELKKADSPLGVFTIKNNLKNIFQEAYTNTDGSADAVKKYIVDAVDKASNLSGFKMSQDNGEGNTYEDILEAVLKTTPTSADEAFDDWFSTAFNSYEPNQKYFELNIKPNLGKLDECESKLLMDFFEVAVEGQSDKVSIEQYITGMNSTYSGKARLNVKIDGDKPKLLELLPNSVKESFEKYLITPKDGSALFVYDTPECYKLTISSAEPKKEEYKVPDTKVVLDWFKNETKRLMRRRSEPEVKDANDTEAYVDSDAEKTQYKFPGSFDNIVNYQDNWRADITGRLWKKDSTGKFVEYTDDDLVADSKKFETKDGHCGNLCIFDTPDKCSKFFEKMTDKNMVNMTIDELSKEINSADFVKSYKELKENIINVNPLFVVGTLRMFGFEKFVDFTNDGTKIVKIESFTRWWDRYGNKLNLTPNSPFPGTHKGLTPEPPANLELFFKLLIAFINNNEFVLNPQSKELINKSGKPKVSLNGPPPKYFKINGKDVLNKYYEQSLAIYEGRTPSNSEQPESLSNLVETMRKNALLNSKPVNMGLPENRANLSTLLNLMIGITTGGKFRVSTMLPFSTGKGYHIGGVGSDSKILPCANNAFEIYRMGIDALNKKNKKLTPTLAKSISSELKQLEDIERGVYENLGVIATYVKIINVMNDEAVNNDVTSEIMENAIKEYELKSNKLSSKADSTISMLIKNLFDEKNTGSYYTKL